MLDLIVDKFALFLLVVVRVMGMFSTVPFFGGGEVPPTVRVGLTISISAIVFPLVETFMPSIPPDALSYGLLIINEALVGMVIGFVTSAIFAAFQLAGQFLSIPMGFGIVEVLDPLAQIQVPVISQMLVIAAFAIFIGVNGHHLLVRAVVESFSIIPVINLLSLRRMSDVLGFLFQRSFLIGLRIAMPIMGIIFLTDLSLGLLAKAAPQANVFFIGFPLKIFLGLISFMIIMPVVAFASTEIFDELFRLVEGILRVMGRV